MIEQEPEMESIEGFVGLIVSALRLLTASVWELLQLLRGELLEIG